MAPADRQPACVKACPTGARLFGDIKDPLSEVSIAIRERGGYALMPEWNTRPANHYLPRRPTPAVGATRRCRRSATGHEALHVTRRWHRRALAAARLSCRG